MAASALVTGKPAFHSLNPPDLNTATRAEMQTYFDNTYDIDETLFTGITDEAFYMCPDRLRLPLVFYYAHTATVYINKMLAAGLIKERVNRDFEALFETGVDEMSWDDTENYRMGGAFEWPSLKEVHEYRATVRDVVSTVIASTPIELPITMDSPLWSIFLSMEHERIHIETSSVLIRQLPMKYITGLPELWVNAPISADAPPGENALVKLGGEGTKASLGKPRDFPSFGWDNEYGECHIAVPECEVSQYLVSNNEYLKFVRAGGYQTKECWTQEGWRWVEYREVKHPVFWVCTQGCKNGCGDKAGLSSQSHCVRVGGGGPKKAKFDPCYTDFDFQLRTIYEVIPLPGDWPVEINYHEAKAYCRWKGPEYRLPTEAEMALMRDAPEPGTEGKVESDIIYKPDVQANINLRFGTASPVNLFAPSKAGVYDSQGNVWQWQEDHFNGLPGFKSHFLYDDFSSPCFDGRHTMILGGSFIATGDEASRFARFAFRRHFIQHAGFRVVKSLNETPARLTAMPGDEPEVGAIPRCPKDAMFATTNGQLEYESEEMLEAKAAEEFVADTKTFYPAFAELCSKTAQKSRALVVGSGAGHLPCLLSSAFDDVIGQDYCGVFTKAATRLVEEGGYKLASGTAIERPASTAADRVQFLQLTWLPVEIGLFDLVAVNLFLERALNPNAWLARFIGDILTPGGTLAIASTPAQMEAATKILSSRSLKLESQTEISPAPCDGGVAVISIWKQ
mmetsp:Transcript_21902/g.57173  ORF Transcript_21902/g.57173 Transcript_21902/m.57173 type:complete len:737 (+) Transcript_21902:131-2341(+)